MTRTEFWLLVAADLAGLALILAGETAAGLGLVGFGSGYSTRERLQAHRRADLDINLETTIQVESEDVATALRNNTGGIRERLRAAIVPAILLSAGLFCEAQEPPAAVEVLAGAGVSVSDDSAVVPVATVTVDAPVYLGDESVARVRAALRLHGSPGQTLDLADIRTFQGAELDLQLERRIGSGDATATYAVAGGGFATRRDARGEGPRERFPLWYYAGLAVEHREDGRPPSRRLVVGLGSSQVTHPESLIPRDLMVSGHVRLARAHGVDLTLQGDAQRPLWGRGRGVFRLAALVGWGG